MPPAAFGAWSALFLDRFAATIPDGITRVALPAYAPELNAVERIWDYLKER